MFGDYALYTANSKQQNMHSVPVFKSRPVPSKQNQCSITPALKTNRPQEDTCSELLGFIHFLEKKGMRLNGDTPKDGNCFFWALSSQIRESKQSQLRQSTVDYLKKLSQSEKNKYEEFMECKFDDYVFEMAKNGTYADHIAIEACSQANKVAIRVLQETGDVVIGGKFQKEVCVGYIPQMVHYVAVSKKTAQQLQLESYYAVERFYIGRLVKQTTDGFWLMKFLHQRSENGVHFQWPQRPDTDVVHGSNVFFGPIMLSGCLDYTIDCINDITLSFKARGHVM